MKEKTKKNLKDNLELIAAVVVSATLVYQVNTCSNLSANEQVDKKTPKTTVSAPTDSVNVNSARLNMITANNIKSR